MEKIIITKASGETDFFSEEKLRRSLERVSASPETIERIIQHIKKELKPGMPTSQIYGHAFSLLRKEESSVAASRYALKQAIRDLGPSGHPFEKLVGRLLSAEGFVVEVGKIVQGLCVSHELDVIAQKDNRHIMVECKFHNQPGIKSDVKVALYIQARFEDVARAWERDETNARKFHEAWLVTNTKLTGDAVRYAECVGMKAIGWSYPENNGLEIRLDRLGLHPVTCLTTLTDYQKQQLLERNVILCKELSERELSSLGLKDAEIAAVFNEISQLCHTNGITRNPS